VRKWLLLLEARWLGFMFLQVLGTDDSFLAMQGDIVSESMGGSA